MRETSLGELRIWEAYWNLELEEPDDASTLYLVKIALEAARGASVAMQVAIAKQGDSIDPNKIKLSDMLFKFEKPKKALTEEEYKKARKEAAQRSKARWGVRLRHEVLE